MPTRLFPLLLAVSLIAGCGGPADESPEPTGADPAAEAAGNDGQNRPRQEIGDRRDEQVDPGNEPADRRPQSEEGDDGNGSMRKWTDPAGNVLATAEFIELMDDKVCLQEANGLGCVISLEDLSQADRDYVKLQVGEAEPEPAPETLAADDPPESAEATEEAVQRPRAARQEYDISGKRKVVIPFDFQSKFDEGRYGGMVGDMVWKKLEREGGFLIPDSMFDVRDLCAANNVRIGPDTPLDKVREVVRRDFDADIGIWGSVERVPGHEWDVYDLTIKCVDFSTDPDPKVIYEKTGVRTKVVSEIPHLYVKELLDKLYDRQPGGPPPIDQFAEENWKKNPNLVEGGDFERGTGGVPLGWESRGGQQREPLGGLVSWVPEAGASGNRVIRLTFDAGVGDSTGVMYYSKPFPVEEGAKYRFQCRWRSNGPSPKVFIKCYALMQSEYSAQQGYKPTQPGRAAYNPGRGNYVPEEGQLRECYRSQQNLKGPNNTWNVQVEDFTPKHTKYTPRWGRVMLYAYLGGGVVEFDDVVLKQIVPASPSESKKDPRHSMESGVTLEEMRENERRAREAREKLELERTGRP